MLFTLFAGLPYTPSSRPSACVRASTATHKEPVRTGSRLTFEHCVGNALVQKQLLIVTLLLLTPHPLPGACAHPRLRKQQGLCAHGPMLTFKNCICVCFTAKLVHGLAHSLHWPLRRQAHL